MVRFLLNLVSMASAPDPRPTAAPASIVVPTDVLDRILARLDRMEQQLEKLADPVDQAPNLIAAATDTVDGWTRSAQDRGVDLDASVAAGARLLERLANTETLERLERIIARLDAVEGSLDIATQLPGTIAMAGDVTDQWIRRAQDEGLDIDATLKAALPCLMALSNPKIISALETLAQRTPELAKLVDDGPKLIAAAFDSLDGVMKGFTDRGVDVQAMSENIAAALSKLSELLNSPQYLALMNSGVLDPSTLDMVGKAGSALVHARMEACVETGMFGALRATSDRDIQRAIGFAIKFAHAFGRELAQPDNLKHLAAQNGAL